MALPTLLPNSRIQGKWNKNTYKVLKKLGEGGIGAVYQVVNLADNKNYALKLSEDNISLNREYGLLKDLEQIDIIVNAYEIDDLYINKNTYYFIVMEYIPGISLNKHRKNKKTSIMEALGVAIILLNCMGKLHEKGYILGDAKLDNIMVNGEGKVIRIIDLGGVVKMGSTIKEFTPAYDRASWQCGSRTSESTYDLFSATMILIQLLLVMELNPRNQSIGQIKEKLNNKSIDSEVKGHIISVLDGKKEDIKDFANTLLNLYNKERINEKIVQKKNTDYKINLFFASSLSLLLTTIWLLFVK